LLLALMSGIIAIDRAWEPATLFGLAAVLVCGRAVYECAAAMALMREAVATADAGTISRKRETAAPTASSPDPAPIATTDTAAAAADLELGTS
jgi:hypothetical protein